MKIVKVNVIPLVGGTVDGGWPQGHEKKENLHTLLEVVTDEGISGVGGVYTSGALTEGAIGLLAGARRFGRTCHQRDRYRLVGHYGQSLQATRLAALGGQLPRSHQALR